MKKSEKLISAIVTIVFGSLLIVLQAKFIGILMTIAGGALIVLGIVNLLQRRMPLAVIKIVTGVFIIICGWELAEAVLYVLSAVLLICGILLLYDKLKHEIRCLSLLQTVFEYAKPALLILIGILLLFNQSGFLNFIFVVCGILTIMEGGLLLIDAITEN